MQVILKLLETSSSKINFSKSQALQAVILIKQDRWYGHSFPLKYLGYILFSKNNQYLEQCATLSGMKTRIANQILLSKLWYMGQVCTILKFIIKKLEKAIAQLPIW